MKESLKVYLKDRMPNLSDEEIEREVGIIIAILKSSVLLMVSFDGTVSTNTNRPVTREMIEKIVSVANELYNVDDDVDDEEHPIIQEANRIINGETT